MALQEQLNKLQNFDINDLDPDNIGGWPLPLKAVIWCLVFVAVVVASHQLVIQEKSLLLDTEVQNESRLKGDFEQKVQEAANIEKYKDQMVEMEKSFSALLAQLPKDTEVPGLLDDITNKGLDSGLTFKAIDLKPEKKAEFYVELPIDVRVVGGYHDFGAFVSGVAGLPRIVTLHDFVITSSSEKKEAVDKSKDDGGFRSDELLMTITAKTYRYKSENDTSDEKQVPKPAASAVKAVSDKK
jgi:type IV pilus assembly protein PilO